MRALTVRQPWASLISSGQKTIEVRSWRTNYRGPLLITASARRSGNLPTGCTICTVELLDCVSLRLDHLPATGIDEEVDAADCAGLYAWLLANPKPLPPQPIKGRLNLWRPPQAIIAQLL